MKSTRKTKSFAEIDPDVLHLYNARDCLVTRRALDPLLGELDELGGRSFYDTFMPGFIWAVRRMAGRGVLIDDTKRQDLLTKVYGPFLEGALSTIQELTWPGFNPSTSSYDTRWYLFGKKGLGPRSSTRLAARPSLGLQPTERTPTGLAAVNSDVIHKLSSSVGTQEGCSFLEAWSNWNDGEKITSTYLEHLPLSAEGRARFAYKIHGTETGRLSGPFQTWPDGDKIRSKHPGDHWVPGIDVRDIVIAPRGKALGSLDYSAIEFVVFAYETKAPLLLEIVHSGRDVHEENARYLFDLGSTRTLDQWQRDFGKTFIFGTVLYDGNPRSVNIQADLLARVHEGRRGLARLKDRFLKDNPQIPAYHEKIRDQVTKTRTLINAFGRPRYFLGHPDHIIKEAYNYPIQSAAVHLTNDALIRIEKNLPRVAVCGHHHDALSPIELWQDTWRKDLWDVAEVMCDTPRTLAGENWKVAVTAKEGTRWGSMKRVTR